jgi:hypothetical protein
MGAGATGLRGRTGCAPSGLGPPARAAANSAAVPNRSAGSFCSATITAASIAGGTVFRCRARGLGSSASTRATIAWAVAPVKGGSPVSIS